LPLSVTSKRCNEKNRAIFLRLIHFCDEVEYSLLQISLRLRSFSLQPRRKKPLLVTALLGFAWTTGIAFGLRPLLSYKSTPDTIGAVPTKGPTASQIERLPVRTATFVFGCALANRSHEGDKARCLK